MKEGRKEIMKEGMNEFRKEGMIEGMKNKGIKKPRNEGWKENTKKEIIRRNINGRKVSTELVSFS